MVAACFETQAGQIPVVTPTNLTFTVMAGNLTGNSQRYEGPQIRILQAVKPDIAALQEFNATDNSPAGIRSLVDTALGTNYFYFRESSSTETYSIPNGIVSRFPILEAGAWDDVTIPDRGFAWAHLQLPGSNELYVVSVHLKASSSSSSQRVTQAANLTKLVQAAFPAGAWIVVAGDFNTSSRSEAALTTFKTWLSDSPIPTDAASGGHPETNEPRSKPYDYVLPSFSLTNHLTTVVVGGQSFPNGLIFDSRVFTPLSAVAPVQTTDSASPNAQHMAVLKAFQISYTVTNWVTMSAPVLRLIPPRSLQWEGPSNVVFTLQASTNLLAWVDWQAVRPVSPGVTHYSLALTNPAPTPLFLRVRWP